MITSDRSPANKIHEWQVCEIEGIRVHQLPVGYNNAMSFHRRMVAFGKFALAAGPRAVKLGGDVVFATSTPLTIAIPGLYASKRLNIPMVFEVRDLWPELPIAVGALRNPVAIGAAKWLERITYRNSAHIVALSPGMADGIARTSYPDDQITIVPNACDIALFQNDTLVNGLLQQDFKTARLKPHVIVYAGTIGRINGVEYLVDVAHQLHRDRAPISSVVIGDGALAEQVRDKARHLGVLDQNFWLIPAVPKMSMPAVLHQADLAASLFTNVPEMRHNSANKFFDALAAGRPVLINYEGWQADLIRSEGIGLVVPPDKPRVAAKLIQEFFSSERRVKRAGAAALQLARECFSRDRLAGDVLGVLESAIRQ